MTATSENKKTDSEIFAEFMGVSVYPRKVPAKNKRGWKYSHKWNGEHCQFEHFELKYNTSLDWIKPVVDRIGEFSLVHPDQVSKVTSLKVIVDSNVLRERCIEFIKWLNKQPK